MHTIAVFNIKGGVGKSAITVFLADFLSTVFDQRVLVIDLDPQQGSTVALLGEDRLLMAMKKQKSLGRLLLDSIERKSRASQVFSYLTERPMIKGTGRYRFLQAVSVLASDREAWHDLNDRLTNASRDGRTANLELLRNALRTIETTFDICLIDFPASYTGPISRNGIVAADWWLFPVEPNRLAARDVDGPRHFLQQIWQQTNHKPKGLGTVLSRCQNRQSKQYTRTKAVLAHLSEQRHVPRIFSRAAEISFKVDALNSLDDTLQDSHRTIDQKYGGAAEPLHQEIRKLTREVLERLRIPFQETTDVDTTGDVNR